MESSRRSFLRSACASSFCTCLGAGLAADAAAGAEAGGSDVAQEDPMPRRWIAALLPALEASPDREAARRVLKAAAQAHWEHLRMDEKVAPYRGNLDTFLAFLTAQWGWKIQHDRAAGVILVDEAKSYCVCPLVEKGSKADLTQLCDCSEGFAERLFGAVVEGPVRAEVTQSVLRGATSCHYQITLTQATPPSAASPGGDGVPVPGQRLSQRNARGGP